MCLSCGCGDPDNDHGNCYNITIQDIWDAANAGGVQDAEDVVNNIENTYAMRVDPDFHDVDDSRSDHQGSYDSDDDNDTK